MALEANIWPLTELWRASLTGDVKVYHGNIRKDNKKRIKERKKLELMAEKELLIFNDNFSWAPDDVKELRRLNKKDVDIKVLCHSSIENYPSILNSWKFCKENLENRNKWEIKVWTAKLNMIIADDKYARLETRIPTQQGSYKVKKDVKDYFYVTADLTNRNEVFHYNDLFNKIWRESSTFEEVVGRISQNGQLEEIVISKNSTELMEFAKFFKEAYEIIKS